MNALIILAHGSRRQESNNEIKTLTATVRNLAADKFTRVDFAFLELAEPDLHQAIEKLVTDGIRKVTVLPYFLNSGNHVKQDIPEMIMQANTHHPDCEFNVTDCIGMYQDMPNLILQQAIGPA